MVQLAEVLYHTATGDAILMPRLIELCEEFFLENNIEKWIEEQGGYGVSFRV